MVATEGVVPRQPVDQHRRHLAERREALQDLLLVGAEHALGIDHTLGQLGRARGEQELGDGVGADLRMCGVDGGSGRRGQQFLERQRGAAVDAARGQHHRCVGRDGGGDGAAIGRGVGGEHQPRRQCGEDVLQLAVVLRDQRIRRRDRRIGHTGQHATEAEQQVLEVVVRQDGHRPLGRQAAVDQRLCNAARAVQRLGVADAPPVATVVALGRERALGRVFGPVQQAVGQAHGGRRARLRRTRSASCRRRAR